MCPWRRTQARRTIYGPSCPLSWLCAVPARLACRARAWRRPPSCATLRTAISPKDSPFRPPFLLDIPPGVVTFWMVRAQSGWGVGRYDLQPVRLQPTPQKGRHLRCFWLSLSISVVALLRLCTVAEARVYDSSSSVAVGFQKQVDLGRSAASGCFNHRKAISETWFSAAACVVSTYSDVLKRHADTDGFLLGFSHTTAEGLELIRVTTWRAKRIDRRDWPVFAGAEDIAVESFDAAFQANTPLSTDLCASVNKLQEVCTRPTIVQNATQIASTDRSANNPAGARKWSGSGTMNSPPFTTAGAWTVHWSCSGDIFQIYVHSEDGELEGVAANQIGAGSGASYEPQKGKHFLQFNAVGRWAAWVTEAPPER